MPKKPSRRIKVRGSATVPEQLVEPLRRGHGNTVRLVGAMKGMRKQLPRALRDVWPNL